MVIGLCGSCLVLSAPGATWKGAEQLSCPRGLHMKPVVLSTSGWSSPGQGCPLSPGSAIICSGCWQQGGHAWGRARAFGKPRPQPLQQLTCVVFSDLRISRKAQEETVSLLRRKGNSSQWAAGSKVSALPPPGTGRWAVSACRCSARCTVPL